MDDLEPSEGNIGAEAVLRVHVEEVESQYIVMGGEVVEEGEEMDPRPNIFTRDPNTITLMLTGRVLSGVLPSGSQLNIHAGACTPTCAITVHCMMVRSQVGGDSELLTVSAISTPELEYSEIEQTIQ